MGSRQDGESSPEPRFQNIFQRTLCDVKTTSKDSIVSIVGSVVLLCLPIVRSGFDSPPGKFL